jgi:NhaP-type Na+/H+ or K+/H+ antiporter
MEATVLTVVLAVVVAGFAAQWIAWRLALPAIVVLLGVGLAVGPGAGLLDPSEGFGGLLKPVVGLVVALIVFEGGLSLNLRELRAAGQGVLRLTAVALPLNALFGAAAAHWIGGFGWPAAALFGAIMVVTGPTVILPLLRVAKLEARSAAFLKWEAIVNDPVGAILAVVVLELLILNVHGAGAEEAAAGLGATFAAAVAAALALGAGAAVLVRWSFRRDQVPEILKVPMLLALALGVYALSNAVLEEAGLIAATVFGVALANLDIAGLKELRRFNEALVVLLVSGLFIVLTADLERAEIAMVTWPVVGLIAAMLILVRPAAILLATAGSTMTWAERTLCAWIAPRGIVAAAVAGLASLRLEGAGYAGAELVQPAAFAVIATTVVVHGFTLKPLARRLGLVRVDRPGVMVVGISEWTLGLADALKAAGVPVLMIDTYPRPVLRARRRGHAAVRTEILSETGEERVEDRALDYLIAATPDDTYNALVCARLAPELGRERVLQTGSPHGLIDPDRGPSRDWRGKVLADEALGHDAFAERYAAGWRFRILEPGEDGPAGGVALMGVRADLGLVFASPEDGGADPVAAGGRTLVFAPPDAGAARRTETAAAGG